MLYNRILSRTLAVPFKSRSYTTTIMAASSSSSAAMPPQSFVLDRKIFNDGLYTHLRSFWFADIRPGSKHGNAASLKRWWGAGGRTEEESRAFDKECREHYGGVLEMLRPERIALSSFESYEQEIGRSEEVAKPFLKEVQEGEDKGWERLLALVVLLDQIPRNIHRDMEGLRLVYGHYDRLAWALVRASIALPKSDNPWDHESLRGNVLVMNWLIMPLMHAEDLESQHMAMSMLKECLKEAREDGDEETVKEGERALIPAGKHLDIIEKFGRFPHRNECLGRRNTGEEEEWLKTGETFGVKQAKRSEAKAEL